MRYVPSVDALYYAKLFDMMGLDGEIITIDVDAMPDMPQHPRIKYLMGSSTSGEIISKVKEMIKDKKRVMVILDSDHTCDHVYRELELYHGFVSPGQYLVVEDSNINGEGGIQASGRVRDPWKRWRSSCLHILSLRLTRQRRSF